MTTPDDARIPEVVGLDLSLTATGVAWADGSTGLLKTKERGVERLEWILAELLDVLEGTGALVVIEGYSFGSPNQAAHLGELGGVVRVGLHQAGIRFANVPPSSLKKYATGTGNASKGEVLAAAVRRLGYDGGDHNEADALWLRAIGRDLLGWPVATVPAEHRAALSKIDWPEDLAA